MISVSVASRRPLCAALLVVAAATASLGGVPSGAAADQVYWANFVTNKISHANLDGSGGVVDLNTSGATANEPIGLAIDPVGGRVYWANHTGGTISWASLDGSGGGDLATGAATVSGPTSPSIDVAGRKIYWLNEGNDTVAWASLDGSGGADLDIGTAPIDLPGALAVDPAVGRLYWTNWGFISDGWVSSANLDGSGGQKLPITGATLDTPFGMAIDAAAGRLYWVNDNPGIVSSANLDGSGASDLDARGLEMKGPYGLALDPEAGQGLPCEHREQHGSLSSALTGRAAPPSRSRSRKAALRTSRHCSSIPGRGAPRARRASCSSARRRPAAGRACHAPRPSGKAIGISLSCSPGNWAGDLVEAFLYPGSAVDLRPVDAGRQSTSRGATSSLPEHQGRRATIAAVKRPPTAPARPRRSPVSWPSSRSAERS